MFRYSVLYFGHEAALLQTIMPPTLWLVYTVYINVIFEWNKQNTTQNVNNLYLVKICVKVKKKKKHSLFFI